MSDLPTFLAANRVITHLYRLDEPAGASAAAGSFDVASATAGNQNLFTSATLAAGSHTLLLTCTSGALYLDAIQVTP